MNTFKRISAIVLALVMVLSLGVTVFATTAPTPYSGKYEITIKNVENDLKPHTYNAYQIFKGKLAEDGGKKLLSDIEWGDNIPAESVEGPLSRANMIAALVAIDLGEEAAPNQYPFAGCTTAEEFAEALSKNTAKDNAVAVAFAATIEKYLVTPVAGTADSKVTNQDEITAAEEHNSNPDNANNQIPVPAPKYEATITVEEAGYYLIEDATTSGTGESTAKTKYILQVLDDVDVQEKTDVPTVDKVIDEDGGVKMNEVSIGDKVPYKVTSDVPDMTYFEKYWYILNDTMSEGLTFQNDVTFKITYNGTDYTLTRGVDYDVFEKDQNGKFTVKVEDSKVFADADAKTELKIAVYDLKAFCDKNNIPYYTEKDGQKLEPRPQVVVTYSAVLNEYAKITEEANTNEVDLEYSNNPNSDYDGEPNNPGPENPTGTTPKSKTETFTTGAKIFKYYLKDKTQPDEEGNRNPLAGAKFTIKGEKLNKVVEYGTVYVAKDITETEFNKLGIVNEEGAPMTFAEFTTYTNDHAADFKYWALNTTPVTYTETAPEGNIDKTKYVGYDASSDTVVAPKYALMDFRKVDTQETQEIILQGYTDENGNLTIDGLEDGVYTITEAIAPDGFNKLNKNIILEIASVWNENTGKYDWWYRTYEEGAKTAGSNKPNGKNDTEAINDGWIKYYDGDGTNDSAECPVYIKNDKGLELPSTGGMGTTIFYIVGGLMLVVALAVCVAKVMAPKAVSTKIESI